jgi:hypothetical protein
MQSRAVGAPTRAGARKPRAVGWVVARAIACARRLLAGSAAACCVGEGSRASVVSTGSAKVRTTASMPWAGQCRRSMKTTWCLYVYPFRLSGKVAKQPSLFVRIALPLGPKPLVR